MVRPHDSGRIAAPEPAPRGAFLVAAVLLAFAALFQLLGQVQFFRTFEDFVYPWDGALWLFGDGLLSVGSVVLVRRLLGREEHSTPYLRVLIVSLLLFVPVSVGEQVLVERYLFGKSHASYTILRYAAFQTTWHLIVANGYIAYRYLTELGRARSRLLTAERDRAETELRRLQQAVSPHFLFNALNVLHALIADDPGRAGEFTTRLARLYRYILRHRDVEVVSLRDELAFVRDYAYLLQTRFGGAWRFEIDDAPPGADLFVVPAAVQGLVENAVKHNVARVEHPVTLSIRIEGDRLVVRNPRHPRADAAASSGAGLDLLRARYARLDDRGVRVHASDDAFEVTLPLIRAV